MSEPGLGACRRRAAKQQGSHCPPINGRLGSDLSPVRRAGCVFAISRGNTSGIRKGKTNAFSIGSAGLVCWRLHDL